MGRARRPAHRVRARAMRSSCRVRSVLQDVRGERAGQASHGAQDGGYVTPSAEAQGQIDSKKNAISDCCSVRRDHGIKFPLMTNLLARVVAAAMASIAARPVPSLGSYFAHRLPPSCSSHPAPTENLAAQLAKFRPVQMPFNTTGLSTREVQMVRKLVEAGQNLESIFWRQSDPQGLAIYQALANCPGATEKQIHHYLLI